ncbi:MAG TPA: tetratricopeptide repeat protein [Bryobacteraceae bacterium]|nr:tetratricopeptide repeat protein [Bryobacteraceae bacterium]
MRARLLLLAGALAAFGASLGSGFHFDDYAIFQDAALTSARGWLDVWTLRQTRPLTYLSFWLNYQIGGRDPVGYHLLNLALHAGCVLLGYECLRRLLPKRAALLAAAIFAVHPIQAEAVNYVWGRSIVLATLLALAAWLCWITGRWWAAVACFAAALLAKEEVAAFPLVLVVMGMEVVGETEKRPDETGRGRQEGPLHVTIAMLLLSLAAGARVIYATAVTPGAPAGLQAPISASRYLLTQGPVILRYLRLLLIPYGFTIDPEIRVPAVWEGVAAWLAIVGAIVLALRRRTAWSCWLLAGFILLIPSSSLFPAADLAADRRMYFPLLAFAAAIGILLERVRRPAIAICAATALTLASVARTQVWMTEESLWQEAVERAPEKVRPKIQLARALPAPHALEVLAQARTLAPGDPAVAAETGKTLLAAGRPEAALQEFGRALALDPRDPRNLNNRGVALAAMGQTEAARADFERALSLDPSLAEARANLQKLAR